jgi:transposase
MYRKIFEIIQIKSKQESKITININDMEKQELKALIKETMKEVIQEERHNLYQVLIPYVDEEEQQELEAEFGIPLKESGEELVDLTDWVKNGGQISQTSD